MFVVCRSWLLVVDVDVDVDVVVVAAAAAVGDSDGEERWWMKSGQRQNG